MGATRPARFRRASNPPSFQITNRDVQLIFSVFQHRFLQSTQLVKLAGGSRQQVLRRLHRLFHHGYLDRPKAQVDYYRNGSQPMVYGVGQRGVKHLEQSLAIPHRKLDWSAKNRNATRFFLEHTLAVAEVMVALELACRDHDDIELIHHEDELLKWHVEVRQASSAITIGVIPDRVFGLRRKNNPTEVVWYFLEADRATMPVERHSLKQSSFARKLRAYHETWRQGVLKNSFPRFRVLTVTTTPERVHHLISASRALAQGKGSGLFLFTHLDAFGNGSCALNVPLLDGRGDTVTLAE
jgi:DNA-binding Lrp family transcriptional regulator